MQCNSVVVKTEDSQFDNPGSIPGASTGQPSRSSLRGRRIDGKCRQYVTTVEDCEGKSVRLYDGRYVMAGAAIYQMPHDFMQPNVVLEVDVISYNIAHSLRYPGGRTTGFPPATTVGSGP